MEDCGFSYRNPNPWNPGSRIWNPSPAAHRFRTPRTSPASVGPYFEVTPTIAPATAAKSKVISVPVEYSSPPTKALPTDIDRSQAAVRIQSEFRGSVVRKHTGLVRALAAEVAEMERRVASAEEGVWRDEKERVRANETLMRILLKLDSVSGVRGFRRKVIRRVISLQERIDSLSAAPQTLDPSVAGTDPAAAEDGALDHAMVIEPEVGEAVADELRAVGGGVPAERLMGIVVELLQGSAEQRRLIRGLVKRVEHLERLLLLEKGGKKDMLSDLNKKLRSQ